MVFSTICNGPPESPSHESLWEKWLVYEFRKAMFVSRLDITHAFLATSTYLCFIQIATLEEILTGIHWDDRNLRARIRGCQFNSIVLCIVQQINIPKHVARYLVHVEWRNSLGPSPLMKPKVLYKLANGHQQKWYILGTYIQWHVCQYDFYSWFYRTASKWDAPNL